MRNRTQVAQQIANALERKYRERTEVIMGDDVLVTFRNIEISVEGKTAVTVTYRTPFGQMKFMELVGKDIVRQVMDAVARLIHVR